MPVAARAAVDLPPLWGQPLQLELTDTSLLNWHADNRNKVVYDDHYGELLNRLNLSLIGGRITAGLRLDTSTFFRRPDAAALAQENAKDPNDVADLRQLYETRLRYRYRDQYLSGKAFVTYSAAGVEATVGDSYLSLGRGLILSLRKQDELAVDTTLFGGKVGLHGKQYGASLAAGYVNPVRTDEATGQSLACPDSGAASLPGSSCPAPVFSSDLVSAGHLEGTLKGITLGAQAARVHRPTTLNLSGPARGAKDIDGYGASLSAPNLFERATVYLESMAQRQSGNDVDTHGYGFYASANTGFGSFSPSIELQHYRDLYPVLATVDTRRAEAFQTLRYNAPPNTERVLTDTRYLSFDKCVSGGRARLDGRLNPDLLLYAGLGSWATWGERNDACLEAPTPLRNDVIDGLLGTELLFDQARSHVFASAGLRRDTQHEDGALYYKEARGELSTLVVLSGGWAGEWTGRYRRRFHSLENFGSAANDPSATVAIPWTEAESYLSAKYAPSLGATLGYEYTSAVGFPSHYFNGSLTWRFTSDSSVRLFVGQQRGGLRCVSGVCRLFPPFEGAKLELTGRL